MPKFKFAYWNVTGEMVEPNSTFEDAIFCPIEWNIHDVKRELNARYKKQNKIVINMHAQCFEIRELNITWEQFNEGVLSF